MFEIVCKHFFQAHGNVTITKTREIIEIRGYVSAKIEK